MRTLFTILFCGLPAIALAHGPGEVLPDLVGTWTGTLAYRDYRSDQRVEIPARVVNRLGESGDVLVSDVTFTDPGWLVKSVELTSLAADGSQLTTASASKGSVEVGAWTLDKWFEDDNGWRMVLLGEGTDDGRPAEFRLDRGLVNGAFTSTKEIRYQDEEGADWQFRNELSLAPETASADQLVGAWRVDLRPTPDADPYYQTFTVRRDGDALAMTFYGTPAQDVLVNTDWGAVEFAFTTGDGVTSYHTSGRLVGDRLEGPTHAPGRGFLGIWTAERAE